MEESACCGGTRNVLVRKKGPGVVQWGVFCSRHWPKGWIWCGHSTSDCYVKWQNIKSYAARRKK